LTVLQGDEKKVIHASNISMSAIWRISGWIQSVTVCDALRRRANHSGFKCVCGLQHNQRVPKHAAINQAKESVA
jgi:hypothetical protein